MYVGPNTCNLNLCYCRHWKIWESVSNYQKVVKAVGEIAFGHRTPSISYIAAEIIDARHFGSDASHHSEL